MQQQEEADDGRVLFEMDLWCSDLLMSVLELDGQGNLVPHAIAANPLSPPGEGLPRGGIAHMDCLFIQF